MIFCGLAVHKAVGTASALGLLIALPGAVVYLATGQDETGLPYGSLGYVNVPACVVIAVVSAMTAPLGVRAAHAMPVGILRRVFAVFMVLIAAHMMAGVPGDG
jgi:uncharacterized membrane protein YfcA